MINILFDSLPETVSVDGRDYFIITDFREWIKFHEMHSDADLTDMEKVMLSLEWYEDDIPDNIENAIKALGHFLAAYDIYPEGKLDDARDITKPQAFSFAQDAGDIYSAFRQYYNIDLQKVKYMHWYEFRSMFDNLPGDCEIKQKMYYRTLDAGKIKDKKERKRVREIQEKIRIIDKKKPRYVDDYDIGDVFG